MAHLIIYTILASVAAKFCLASPLEQARDFLAQRDIRPNSNQYWANDFADLEYANGNNGNFSVTWDNGFGGNFVVGRGYRPARDMLLNYTGSFATTGAAYLALYGWTTNPLVEYYVIEAMGNHNPSDNVSATQYGCLTSDGGTYEIWQKKRTNAPSIIGDHTDFEQYWSVRQSMHTGGTINTGNHFRAWEALGLTLGSQLYMAMVIEGQRGRGAANITVGQYPATPVPETPTPTYRTEKKAGTCPYTYTRSSTATVTPATTPPT